MNLSLAFTTYKTLDFIYKQFCLDHFGLSNYLVNEIVVRDDLSVDYLPLSYFKSRNIKIFQNKINLSPLNSRPILVADCKNDWVLLMDADNFLDRSSYDVLRNFVENGLNKDIIYCPDFARPRFNYKKFSGALIDANFAKKNIDDIEFKVFINTCNYLVPRNAYLEVAKNIDISFSHLPIDTVYFNYLWLKSGRKLKCVSNFEYDHTIRGNSFAVTHQHVNREKAESVYSLIRSL